MSEKDIKTKPQSVKKKSAPKTNPHIKESVRDVKSVSKDIIVRDVIKGKVDEAKQNGQSERAEVQATENVENTAYAAADTVYYKGKAFAQNKIKQKNAERKLRQSNAPKTPETQQNANAPKTPELPPANAENTPKERAEQQSQVKTKDSYIQSKSEIKAADGKTDVKVKTRDNYIKSHASESEVKDGIKQKTKTPNAPKTQSEVISNSSVKPKTPEQARKEYVAKKLKTKAEYEKVQAEQNVELIHSTESAALPENIPKDRRFIPSEHTEISTSAQSKSLVKTKESYMQSLKAEHSEPIKSPYRTTPTPKGKPQDTSRRAADASKAVKTKQSLSKTEKVVKSGNVYSSANKAKKTAQKAKTTKRAVKTQKEVTKKAAKEAAKQAKAVAQKAAQTAKAAAKATVRVTVKVAQMVAAAAKAVVSALAALGGWAVLLVVLIIVIVVAAIAGSPFGIFISDEAADSNSIPISSIVAECNMELSAQLTNIEDSTTHNRVVMEGEQANWDEIIAIFAVKTAGTGDETAEDVVIIDEAKKQKLKAVFWDMNTITSRTETVTSGETTETVLYITTTAKTKDEMAAAYHFTDKQKEALETLLENNEVLILSTQSLAISDATAQEVLKALPSDISAQRKAVMKAACSLVGKVNYFWGGKSSAIGWDSNWGKMTLVTAEGSRSSGTMRPFGLDCSGFVTWCFTNSSFNANQIGHGTQGQIGKCSRISWAAAEPGDLAFLSDLSHVGIVAGRDASGNVLVIHCSSSANNVVITTNSIFGFAARPNCY